MGVDHEVSKTLKILNSIRVEAHKNEEPKNCIPNQNIKQFYEDYSQYCIKEEIAEDQDMGLQSLLNLDQELINYEPHDFMLVDPSRSFYY